MKRTIIAVLTALIAGASHAHEMTPTYPKLTPSHLDGLYKTTMTMFNKREDVEFYEIGVFDKDFQQVTFVTSYSIIKIRYLGKVTFEIYLREIDLDRATYVCSRSKLRKLDNTRTAVSSKICSKFEK